MKLNRYYFVASILATLTLIFTGQALAGDIDAKLPDSNNTSSFQVKDSASNVLMKVQSGGNIGLGTTEPKEKVQIGDRLTFHDGGWKVISYNAYCWVNPLNPEDYNDKRIVAGYAAAMAFSDTGDIRFRTAGDGAAGGVLDDGAYSTWDSATPPLIVKNDGKIGIGTDSPNSSLHVNGSFAVKRTAVSGDTSSSGEVIIGVTGSPCAIILRSIDCVEGRVIIIKDESGSEAPNITVSTEGNETIDGADTKSIGAYGFLKVYSNGTNWFIIGSYNLGGVG